MKLLRMALENFKGIKKADFGFNGYDSDIYGANGTGKTTVFDAFTWLLFGKSSEERANFSPKTITADGAAHNLDHSVECEIEIDGTATTFKRVYHEVYKKTRGNAKAVLSGHTTDYYINGVPKKEKEYQKFWSEIFENDEQVKLLSMPFYFPESLHWEKRRAILLDICDDISDISIMETDEELKELAAEIGGNPVEEYKKIVKARKLAINKQLELVPARIDEAEKAIPTNLPTDSKEVLEQRAEGLRKAISEAQEERAAILSGDGKASRIRADIASLNAELAEARAKFKQAQAAESGAALERVQEIRKKLADAESELSQNTRTLEDAKITLERLETRRSQIIEAHKEQQKVLAETESEAFDENSAFCDKCGQALPEDKVLDLKALFNERKSNRLAEITKKMDNLIEDGKKNASKTMVAEIKSKIEMYGKLVTESQPKIEAIKRELEDAQRNAQTSSLPSLFEDTDTYKELTVKIEVLRDSEAGLANTETVDAKIADLRTAETTLNNAIAALETERVQKQRIAELEAEEKKLGAEYEATERSMYLCEKFTRVKAALLNDKINERFKSVKFQLFKQNITNDGIDDICDVLVPTATGAFVPFQDANNAARINAGIEIIETLGEYYGVSLPIFIDNAESVTHIVPTKGQLIRLIVSESDTELRLVTL